MSFLPSPQELGLGQTFQAALGDLDGDGDLDAVFANPQKNAAAVWLNDGRGTLVDTGQQLTQYGHGVGLADFDADGDLDAFIACHQFVTPSKIYLNDGTGLFQDTGQDLGDGSISAAEVNLLDLNGDGHTDVHVLYYDPSGLPDRVYLNDGAGVFADSGLALNEEIISWGDLDGDGDVDYFGKRWGEGYVVQLNDGSGRFSAGWQMEDSQSTVGGVALADLEGDGDLDAVVANGFRDTGSYPSLLLWNDGAAQFADSGQRLNETMGAELAVGDLDNDADLDLFVSNMDRPNEVWLNDGGQFVDSGLRLGENSDLSGKPSLGDLDGDGDLDLVVGRFRGGAQIWFNTTDAERYLGQSPPGMEVEVFAPGTVSIEAGKEYKITFSPDLQEVVFTRRTPFGRNDRLYYSRLEDGQLTMPELAPFAYDALESDSCFTPDGKRIYFNSRRPLPGETTPSEQSSVWFVDRTQEGWGEPQFLGPPLNDYRPVYFSFADDGTLYFTRSRPREIWYSERVDGGYGEAQRLPDEINNLRDIAHPAIAPDESYIIVDSVYYLGERLTGGLYISFKKPDGAWTEMMSMQEALKATETDIYAAARITPDGKYLFFESYLHETDQADIYWVSTGVIEALRVEALAPAQPLSGGAWTRPAVAVPQGLPAVIDGTIAPEEWESARRESFTDGSELFLMHDGGYLYLGIRASTPGMIVGNVYVERGDEIAILHTSAALGTAIYQKDVDSWQQVRDFSWSCRNTSASEAARAERAAFLRTEHWVAANARMGNPNELEYQIEVPEDTVLLAVVFLRASDLDEKVPWPTDLEDDCTKLTPGGLPKTMDFSPGQWSTLTFVVE